LVRCERSGGVGGHEVKVLGDRAEYVEDFSGAFPFNGSKNDGGFFAGIFLLPGFHKCMSGVGVVGGVENVGGVCNFLESAGPSDVGECVADDVRSDGEIEFSCGCGSNGGIALLVGTGDVQVVASERGGDEFERGAKFVGFLLDGGAGFGGLLTTDDGFSRLDDACFFRGDGGDGVSEPLRVVECDRGDDRDIRRDGGGGIEPATHAGFKNDEFAPLLAKVAHGYGEGEFEKCGVVFPVGNEFFDLGEVAGGGFFRDFLAVNLNAFGVGNEVGRGEETSATATSASQRIDDGAGGAFTIGARNMDDLGARSGK